MKASTLVITGVSKGLGFSLAKELCSLGYTVYGCSRSLGKAAEILQNFPETFFFEMVDITKPSEVNSWKDKISSQADSIDFLINNASIINTPAPCWEISSLDMQNVMDINVIGTFICLRAFIPLMIAQKQGMLINISSAWGRSGDASVAPYCASKFAIEGLSAALSKELPEGLAVVTLDPGGGVQTDMLKLCAPDYYKMAPSSEAWAKKAAPFIVSLTVEKNGQVLTCPSVR